MFTTPAGWIVRPSPNFSKRKKTISAIVLHADAASNIQSSLSWVTNPQSEVSYHIMVNRNGVVYQVVSPDSKAWHAGVSKLDGVTNVNEFSVGVCLSNNNVGEVFPKIQVKSAVDVCKYLCTQYGILSTRITTHAIIAPGRKTDPVGLDLETFRRTVAE